jgi:hypothetical protein
LSFSAFIQRPELRVCGIDLKSQEEMPLSLGLLDYYHLPSLYAALLITSPTSNIKEGEFQTTQ